MRSLTIGLTTVLAISGCVTRSEQRIRPAHTDAAVRVVAFLRGNLPFDPTLFADTVTLHIAPEGGGQSRKVARAELGDRENWKVGERSLVPSISSSTLHAQPQVHFNCREYKLASRNADLARLPHVGTRLSAGGESCLQTWNMTVVFSKDTAEPKVVAVLYDQWEW